MIIFTIPSYAQPIEQTKSQDGINLYINKAVKLVINNSSALLENKNEIKKAQMEYDESVNAAKSIKVRKGMTVDTPYGEMYIRFDPSAEVYLRLAKELTPEAKKLSLTMSTYTKKLLENTFEDTSRQIYLGMYSSYMDKQVKEENLVLLQKQYEIDKYKFDMGLITSVDLEISKYNMNNAQKQFEGAKRSLENITRTYNALAMQPLDQMYTSFSKEYLMGNALTLDVNDYIAMALESRFEIVSIQEQIALTEKQIEILKTNDSYISNNQMSKQYKEAQNNLSKLKLQLSQAKLDVEGDIQKAYIDLINEKQSINSLEATLKLQEQKLKKYQDMFDNGMITEMLLDNMKLGVKQVENGLDIAVISYNNKLVKFSHAIKIGPAYNQ